MRGRSVASEIVEDGTDVWISLPLVVVVLNKTSRRHRKDNIHVTGSVMLLLLC